MSNKQPDSSTTSTESLDASSVEMTKEEFLDNLEYLMVEKWTAADCAEYLRAIFTYVPYNSTRAIDIISTEVKSKQDFEEHVFNDNQD